MAPEEHSSLAQSEVLRVEIHKRVAPDGVFVFFELASENLLAGWELREFCKLETQSRRGRRVLSEALPLRSPRLCVSKFLPSILRSWRDCLTPAG